jgi:lambda family phage portal protein
VVTILDQYGKPLRAEKPRQVAQRQRADGPGGSGHQSSYDAAETNDGNYRHWAKADALSAAAANSPAIRKKLRERARYECANNGNAKGTVETIAHDTVGTGPRLQLTIPATTPEGRPVPPDAARRIERLYGAWCKDRVVNLGEKLRIMSESETRDGECFGQLTTNPKVRGLVQLDFQLVETECCASPDLLVTDKFSVDGIRFDSYGNPTEYDFLTEHPGDSTWFSVQEAKPVSADYVVHWFRPNRVGQRRGVPRITPGLPLLAQLRRYSLAVLSAAEVAAMMAGVMETGLAPDDGGAIEIEAYDSIPFERGAMLSLPKGWKAQAFKPEQPTTTHGQFKDTCLTEFGRGVHAPRNVVTGDSSPYNYSSARLDHLIYRGAIRVERGRLEIAVLNPVFQGWLDEALLIPGYLPDNLPPVSEWIWTWQYDGFPAIDPVKDAVAAQIRLECGLTTYSQEFAEDGRDWEEVFEQRAREQVRAEELGLKLLGPAVVPAPMVAPAPAPGTQPQDEQLDDNGEPIPPPESSDPAKVREAAYV